MSLSFHNDDSVTSWGRMGRRSHQLARPRFLSDVGDWNASSRQARLAIGNRRSYSDVCLSEGNRLIDMTGVGRFRSFDPATGVLVAEAGLTIDALLKHFVPLGYFVPVTPGTRFVTLGGAVANDVHGKNHHVTGTFGSHVRWLTLERSGEGTVRTSSEGHSDLFAATIGGLGLTGIISEVAVRLQPIGSSQIAVENVACDNLDELCDGLAAGDEHFEHNVAWIDCTAKGDRLGRGLLSRGNWSDNGPLEPHGDPRRTMPTDRAGALLNPLTLRLFNMGYHAKGKLTEGRSVSHYEPFLYPLDSVLHWNRLYGRRGFYQYQCVIPEREGREPVRELLRTIAASGEGSFLAVLKRFGDRPSPGMLSFPMPGLTLALDFANRGPQTLALLARLDAIVEAASGRLYPAKDMRLPPHLFTKGYPRMAEFASHIDPMCQSDFWKRMAA